MGTSGHMQHPFDIPGVKTGQDLINYFERIVEHLSTNPGSVKFDGINVSFKLVDDESTPTGKDFRMDRGTQAPESVTGMTAADAYSKWPEGHGMPPAIEELLTIFNEALPQIKPELKALGMWDDPTKYFNTEYMKKGKTNVIEYNEKILALHGVNQFYEKKAQAHRVKKGIGVDRPGLERPIDPETGKPTKHGSTEISYDPGLLQSIIEKVKPFAEKHEVSLVGDVSTETPADVDFSETLNAPLTIQMTDTESETHPLKDWLSQAVNPFDTKVQKRDGKTAWAISKEIYFAVLNGTPLMEYLEGPEDVKTAINGALFNHATHELGMDVKRATTSSKGGLEGHEGIVIRGIDDRPVKVTGDFITKGVGGAIKDKIKAAKEKDTLTEIAEETENVEYEIEDDFEDPSDNKVAIGLVPMSAKPYHAGHHMLIELAAIGEITDELQELELPINDIVGVFVSFTGRGVRRIKDPGDKRTLAQGANRIEVPKPGETPVFGSDMKHIWTNILKPNLKLSPKIKLLTPDDGIAESPLRNVHEVCEALKVARESGDRTFNVPFLGITANVNDTVINIYSDDQDIKDNYSDEQMTKLYGDLWTDGSINGVGVPRKATVEISGTKMRDFLCKGDIDSFSKLLPPLPDSAKAEIAQILIQSADLGCPLNRRENKADMESLKETSQIPLGIFLGLIEQSLNEADPTAMFGSEIVNVPEVAYAYSGTEEEDDECLEEEEELEELSGLGGVSGGIEGYAGPGKRDGLIREVEDYLFKLLGVTE